MPRKVLPTPPRHPFDEQYGTDTSGLIEGPIIQLGTNARLADLTAYYGTAPSILEALIDLWANHVRPRPSIERTVFLDVGAGKGRAIMLASQHPFLRVEGVELSPAMAETARANLRLWSANENTGALAPITLHHADATTVELPAEPTLAFLFHPFEATVLRRFLRHVEASLRQRPRPFSLIYANAEHNSLLTRHPAWRQAWLGRVPMSAADHLADLAEIAGQDVYGSTGDELCAIFTHQVANTRHAE